MTLSIAMDEILSRPLVVEDHDTILWYFLDLYMVDCGIIYTLSLMPQGR